MSYGQYKIIDQSTESIKLIGPESKYSGIQLTKSYSANSDNSVDLNTERLNIRETIVNWDLWFNTRMDGFSKVYVPVGNEDEVRMEYRNGAFQEPMPHRIDNGYFYFNPENPSEGMNEKVAKSFIYPSRNRIYAFTKNELFIIEFEMYNKELTHTEHSIIEIYNSVKKNGESLLELEYHSPYKELKPGDKLVSREKWHVVEYDGDMEISSHIAAIENYDQN